MECVLSGILQVCQVVGVHGVYQECRAGDVVHGLLVTQVLRQHRASNLSLSDRFRNKHNRLQAMGGLYSRRQPPLAGMHTQLDSAVYCRSYVVRMSFDFAGYLQKHLVAPHRHLFARQDQPREQSRADARGRRTQAASERNSVVACVLEGRHLFSDGFEGFSNAGHDQVVLVDGDLAFSLSSDDDIELVGPLDRHSVPHVQSYADSVESWTHVRTCSGHSDGD
mmetsp:Transcript_1302/g.2178  ORF Transcript_1302/g.2178 Transcript_1302/m.2178 type:complete len:223 (+) Transcript_1302:368-1036(+)